MKKQRTYNWIASALLFLLTAVCLLTVVLRSSQAALSKPLPLRFTGDYSRDGETWYPLDETADLDALQGELYLRGHLSDEVVSGGRLYYYQDHIGVTIFLNGELLSMDTVSEYEEYGLSPDPSVCGSQWYYVLSPGITPEDEVTFRLCDPHSHGNGRAYREFLETLYGSPNTSYILGSYLKPYSTPFQIAGIAFLVVALMLLGAALVSGVLRVPVGRGLWQYGLLTLFMGGFLILDSVGISLFGGLLVFQTYARQLCAMLAVYCVGLRVRDALTGRPKTVARVALLGSALLNAVCIVPSFVGVTLLYDMGFWWRVSQGLLCPVLLVCVGAELRRRKKGAWALLAPGLLLVAVLLDLAGVGQSIYSHGTCTKLVFVLLLVLDTVGAARRIASDHQGSLRAEQMERELEDSRIAITLSQMQPHFIYNVLNSIYHLCERDPKMAQEAVDKFSDYLRNNMRSIERKGPIPFEEEYQHIRTYLSLEQIRFRTLEIRYDIAVSNFTLPPLTVQPLVENAVKHGVTKQRGGCCVTLSTWETETAWCIQVEDNGVGFDPAHYREDGKVHIGIQNVHQRLKNMVGGTLSLTSAPGEGTTARITIPKHQKQGGGQP